MNDGFSILPWPNKINARVARASEKEERSPLLPGGGEWKERRKKKKERERRINAVMNDPRVISAAAISISRDIDLTRYQCDNFIIEAPRG